MLKRIMGPQEAKKNHRKKKHKTNINKNMIQLTYEV